MNKLKESKNLIREKYKQFRRNLPPAEKLRRDTLLCEKFMNLASYRYADALLMYAPLKTEIDIYPIAEAALKQGKILAFPKCDATESSMTYYKVTDLSQLSPGAFGIMEPNPGLDVFESKEANSINSVCLIPALVYDRQGYRLGYGKGYYDRYLNSFTKSKVGIIYSDCIVDRVPRGRFDTTVDFLITEKGAIMINAN